MKKHQYKGITFAEGWNGTFEQFKSEFENTHVFKALEPKEKLSTMKSVFNDIIALNKANEKEAKQQ